MSYPLDPAAQDAALDALLSGDSSALPTQWELAAYDDDPRTGGVELDAVGGYVRPVINADMTDFPASVDGVKSSIAVPMADPSGPWSGTAKVWVLVDHADSTTRWFFGRLLKEIAVVTGTETDISMQLSIYWNQES